MNKNIDQLLQNKSKSAEDNCFEKCIKKVNALQELRFEQDLCIKSCFKKLIQGLEYIKKFESSSDFGKN